MFELAGNLNFRKTSKMRNLLLSVLLVAVSSLLLSTAAAQLPRERGERSDVLNRMSERLVQGGPREEITGHVIEQDLFDPQTIVPSLEASDITETVPVTVTVTETLQRQQPRLQRRDVLPNDQGTVVITKCVTKVEYPDTLVVLTTQLAPPQTLYVEGTNYRTVTVTITKTRNPGVPGDGLQSSGGQGYSYGEPEVKFTHGRPRRGFFEEDYFGRQKLTGFFPDRTGTVLPHFYSVISEMHETEGSGDV